MSRSKLKMAIVIIIIIYTFWYIITAMCVEYYRGCCCCCRWKDKRVSSYFTFALLWLHIRNTSTKHTLHYSIILFASYTIHKSTLWITLHYKIVYKKQRAYTKSLLAMGLTAWHVEVAFKKRFMLCYVNTM